MKKKTLSFHKPSTREVSKGSALQITRSGNGINIQLARQKTEMNMRQGINAKYDWNFDSFSATLNFTELSKIISYVREVLSERNNSNTTNKILEAISGGTGMPLNKVKLKISEIPEVRLPHLHSKTKKTITWKIQEYPKDSNQLTLNLSIMGSMGYRDPDSGAFKVKDNQMLSINLKEEEFVELISVMEAEISNQLEDNLIDCSIINISRQDNRSKSGYLEIKDIRLPNLNIGETIDSIRKDLRLKIIDKLYDKNDMKVLYQCEEV